MTEIESALRDLCDEVQEALRQPPLLYEKLQRVSRSAFETRTFADFTAPLAYAMKEAWDSDAGCRFQRAMDHDEVMNAGAQ